MPTGCEDQFDELPEKPKDPPAIFCPGCGVKVYWYNNCGRFACIQEHGFPIVLDPVKREAFLIRHPRSRIN